MMRPLPFSRGRAVAFGGTPCYLSNDKGELGLAHLLSFSGNKGYHADLFVKESRASEVAKRRTVPP